MAGIEPWHPTADPPQQLAKVRVAQLAAGQFGRITSRQLQRLGVTDSTARDWRRAGYLHPRLPGVTRSGIPVMTPEQTVFDLATYCIDDPVLVRVALAQLEFEGRYDPEALLALCRRGVVGSERLRVAIAQFDPRFASTRSRFERD